MDASVVRTTKLTSVQRQLQQRAYGGFRPGSTPPGISLYDGTTQKDSGKWQDYFWEERGQTIWIFIPKISRVYCICIHNWSHKSFSPICKSKKMTEVSLNVWGGLLAKVKDTPSKDLRSTGKTVVHVFSRESKGSQYLKGKGKVLERE